jgi:serine/threonine protein kinase
MSDSLARTASLLPLLLSAPVASSHPAEGPPRYQVVRELGRGAMGSVYLADQLRPVQRQVALKVAHAAPATARAREQLAFESQALRLLAHDGVVRLYDAGTTDDGRPWLAMEHVAGEPFDAYCDRRSLSVPERVDLLAQVAHAVAHVHARGVLHGDLKPDNILVSEVDGRAVPRLIDFGLATSLHTGSSNVTPDDDDVVVAGTPAYMAPERFTLPHTQLDARADVFALGVLLYEQITGMHPLGAEDHFGDGLFLRAGVAPKPAHAHWQEASALATQRAALRGSTPARLARALRRSDLGAVAQAALAADRRQRTASAMAFARMLGSKPRA